MVGFQLPKDFLIGTANSAFQSEGAWDRAEAENSDIKACDKGGKRKCFAEIAE